MGDLKSFANSSLGFDLNGGLFSFNAEPLQGLLLAMMKKVMDFGAKLERLEYEMESKSNKSDFFSLREKLKTLPSTEDISAVLGKIEAKCDKKDMETLFQNISVLINKF